MMLATNQSAKITSTGECPLVRVQMNEMVSFASSKSTDGTTTSRVPNVPTPTNNEMQLVQVVIEAPPSSSLIQSSN
jgi:hypothetical protein